MPTIYQKPLDDRLFNFSIHVSRLCRSIQKDYFFKPFASQLVRSATSIGANYQEAQAGISEADFANKVRIAKKEAKESLYWLKLIYEISKSKEAFVLIDESEQIVRILQSITTKLRNKC